MVGWLMMKPLDGEECDGLDLVEPIHVIKIADRDMDLLFNTT